MELVAMDAVVVYKRQEFYVSTQVSAGGKTLLVDLLQCQLLSLMGVIPDEQILLSSSGEVLYAPSKDDVATIAVATGSRPRFFLFASAEAVDGVPEMTSDWGQICTKSTFGDAAVVQAAFRKVAPSGATLICGPCARTCTTGFQPVNPKEWNASKELASRFISDVAVVAGDVDVAAPPGFTKLPVELNYSESGDYVYLCIKRGGTRALTQVHVLFEQLGGGDTEVEGVRAPEKVLEVNCISGDVGGDGNGLKTRIGYDSVQLKGNMEQLETLAITDITVVVNNSSPPSPAYVKISRNLNEGARGGQPVFLYYRLSSLGGFVCDSGREHSEFGECFFAARHLANVKSILDLDERRLTVAQPMLAAERVRDDAAIMEAHYLQHQPGMLQRLQSGLYRAQTYENKQMQEEALSRIPVDKLHERARANPTPMPLYQDELVKQLLHWFKREFFTWMNQPCCSACSHENTRSVRTEGPSTPEETAGKAVRVEVYQCPECGAFTRFPRYNDPVKLLDTRTGRCGEWANCFTLCCRAMGFEARYVLDVTDHVWTEVYSGHFKRWLHCDSCEDQLDSPLTYEVGWGKKLSYIFSFAHDEVVDTARRYTQNWAEMRSRRQDVNEKWLDTTINQINRSLWERQNPERIAILKERANSESEELLRSRVVQKTAIKGRVSGSAEWKSQRNEEGKEEAASKSTTSSVRPTVNSATVADLLQQVCKSLVVGCQAPGCTNPFCLTGRAGSSFPEAPSDVNAIEVVTSLSSNGFSSESLAMLRCPAEELELRSFVWKQKPLVYLSLQDSPSSHGNCLLMDISGHGNHAENKHQGALRKPFKIPNSGSEKSYGLQLLGGRRLSIRAKSALPHEGCMLSFLVRFDRSGSVGSEDDGEVRILAGRLGGSECLSSVEFRVSWNESEQHFTFELQAKNESPKSTVCSNSVLEFGRYAHVAVVRGMNSVTMYTNGTEVGQVDVATEVASPVDGEIAVIEGPGEWISSGAAVISHVAVTAANSLEKVRDFCRLFVSAPPLRAFGTDGELSGQQCFDAASGVQSGYRVVRVLMWGGQFLDGLQFVYAHPSDSSPTIFGALIGNANAKRQASQPTVSLELLADEVITRVSGRKGAWTDCITLHTNFGRAVTCGGKGGGDFSVATPPKSEIRSIAFKASDHLTEISAFVLEASTVESLEGEAKASLLETLSASEPASRQTAISAALRYLDNISKQPEEPKYQRIRASNKFFASNVSVLGDEAAQSFMRWCGFEESSEHGEQFFVFQPPHEGEVSLQRLAAEAHKRIYFLKNVSTQ